MAQSSSPVSGVADRYAQSLFELALEENAIETVELEGRTAAESDELLQSLLGTLRNTIRRYEDAQRRFFEAMDAPINDGK